MMETSGTVDMETSPEIVDLENEGNEKQMQSEEQIVPEGYLNVDGVGLGMNGTMGFFKFTHPEKGESFGLFRANRVWIDGERIKGSRYKTPAKFEVFFNEELLGQTFKADVMESQMENPSFVTSTNVQICPKFYSRCVWKGGQPPKHNLRYEIPAHLSKPAAGAPLSLAASITPKNKKTKGKNKNPATPIPLVASISSPRNKKSKRKNLDLKSPEDLESTPKKHVLPKEVTNQQGTVILRQQSGTCFASFFIAGKRYITFFTKSVFFVDGVHVDKVQFQNWLDTGDRVVKFDAIQQECPQKTAELRDRIPTFVGQVLYKCKACWTGLYDPSDALKDWIWVREISASDKLKRQKRNKRMRSEDKDEDKSVSEPLHVYLQRQLEEERKKEEKQIEAAGGPFDDFYADPSTSRPKPHAGSYTASPTMPLPVPPPVTSQSRPTNPIFENPVVTQAKAMVQRALKCADPDDPNVDLIVENESDAQLALFLARTLDSAYNRYHMRTNVVTKPTEPQQEQQQQQQVQIINYDPPSFVGNVTKKFAKYIPAGKNAYQPEQTTSSWGSSQQSSWGQENQQSSEPNNWWQ